MADGPDRRILREVAAAYAGLEDPAGFPDAAALDRYRSGLLERSAPQADFVARHLQTRTRVLEVACGNGRLLVELARRGVLGEGHGGDIAASRVAFAQRWARDLGLTHVQFAVEDLLATPPQAERFGLALCITGALGYFEPAGEGLGSEVVRRLHRALAPAGLVCLELYPHPGYRVLLRATDGHARIWHELPSEDPWRFYLSELTLEGDVLTHSKTFVHRHDGRIDEGRSERLLLYSPETITSTLEDAGFEDVRLFEGWTERPYAGGEVLVATARRAPRG